jgi:hypothetical protein
MLGDARENVGEPGLRIDFSEVVSKGCIYERSRTPVRIAWRDRVRHAAASDRGVMVDLPNGN